MQKASIKKLNAILGITSLVTVTASLYFSLVAKTQLEYGMSILALTTGCIEAMFFMSLDEKLSLKND
jgi:hypothetical protein